MTQLVVRVEGLGKQYHLGREGPVYGRLSEAVTSWVSTPLRRSRAETPSKDDVFWALRDVTFDVKRGEVLGVVGRNGAGKSTLLKILSRITEPTTGRAELHGRVGSLLEVGTGFHPELTGRENVYLSGSILGMRRREIDAAFDEIVDFAEIGEFLDVPIKRYSSGMNVRLGFAVAAHLQTEILIVDEVLAVGDASFQKKSLAKMNEVGDSGRTILFVSHNMTAVERLCTSAILLDRGRVVAAGGTHEVIEDYLKTAGGAVQALAKRADRKGTGRLRFTGIEAGVRTGKPSEIVLDYAGTGPLSNVAVSIGLFTPRGEGALFLGTEVAGAHLENVPASGRIVCRMERAALLPGRYTMNVYCTVNGAIADWVTDAAIIDVDEGDYFGSGRLPPPGYGSTTVEHSWDVEAQAIEGSPRRGSRQP